MRTAIFMGLYFLGAKLMPGATFQNSGDFVWFFGLQFLLFIADVVDFLRGDKSK